jgi:hypothetical protein
LTTCALDAKSRAISLGYGPICTLTNQKVKMVNGEEDFMNTDDQFNSSLI